MLVSQVALGIFFLYFVLMSGQCSQVMNCSLQRYINSNNWVKHAMIFLSIYIFTFILNWYTIDSLIVEKFENSNKINGENKYGKMKYLTKSFLYSIVIYLVFILSTKNEGGYLIAFLFGSIILVFTTVINKLYNPDIYKTLNNKIFINKNDLKLNLSDEQKNKSVLIHNSMSIFGVLLFLLLFFGSYKYYLRQSLKHRENWSWFTFWLGSNQCRNL